MKQIFANFIERRSGFLIVAFFVLTLVLSIPVIVLDGPAPASTEPSGEAFDLRDDIALKLSSPIFPIAYIAESETGDVLTKDSLLSLFIAQREMREKDDAGLLAVNNLPKQPYLIKSFSLQTNSEFYGVNSVADAVDQYLRNHPSFNTTLEMATNDQVKYALHSLLTAPSTAALQSQLSIKATKEKRIVLGEEIDWWISPAINFVVIANNQLLGGNNSRSAGSLSGDDATLTKEHFARNIQKILRTDEGNYQLWGLAIDQNLEARDEGSTAGVYITLTVIAALCVVGMSLRTYWATALVAMGIGFLMIWLKGLSALLGIKGGLIIEFIVPIAMVSLGVDFAVHAVRRYREERLNGHAPRMALRIGFAGVLSALALAMASDGIAFLSNVPSGIEAVTHFGLSAGVAVFSSFVVLGIIVPLILMRIENLGQSTSSSSFKSKLFFWVGILGVISSTGFAVIFTVALNVKIGVLILFGIAIIFIGIPLLAVKRDGKPLDESIKLHKDKPLLERLLPDLVLLLAKYRYFTLLLTLVITIVSIYTALKLEATFDVKDFFENDSDFVVGLDKLDEHIGDRSGEGGVVYIRGDLSDPSTLVMIDNLMSKLGSNPVVGKETDGTPSIFHRNIINMVRRITSNPVLFERITGGTLIDTNSDNLPDDKAQLLKVFDFIRTNGVPLNESTQIYSVDEVNTSFYHDPEGIDENVTTLIVGIPGTREQAVVQEAELSLSNDLVDLANNPSISKVGLTGAPFTRNAELTASTSALRTSLPIAIAGTLMFLIFSMRSIRFAIVTVIPVLLVASWLYALMYLLGFALNLVTATIGALSVGVGIDYSIHMTERYREEINRSATKLKAIEYAAKETGAALLASAGSSIVGFTVMGFAPMPLFSSYGILTAIMIFLALAAALFVLPSLLILVAGKEGRISHPAIDANANYR